MKKLPKTQMKPEHVKFFGGLDLDSPPLSISPGAILSTNNYQADSMGGYSRFDGYERYSGQPSPSDGVYYYCTTTFTGVVAVGDTVTGDDSGATGVVIAVSDDYMAITKVTGDWVAETFTVLGAPMGTITSVPSLSGAPTGLLDATFLAAAADLYRDDISAPTGSGALRGFGLLDGVLYAFRDNAAADAGLIYKATAAGWVEVTLFYEISFDTGIAAISDGDTVEQLVSGATALVKRVVQESGTWAGGDAAGRLIITDIVGVFNAVNILHVGGANKATSTSLATAIEISPGGRYETITTNFTGSLATKRIYGCDGVNYGFEFDGTTYVPIHTGMTTDTPTHVYAYSKHVFFSFLGSSQNSDTGYPYKWTALAGATEIGLGDAITGYMEQPDDVLSIFCRNSVSQLAGHTSTDFVMANVGSISSEVGGIEHTIQIIGVTYCLDDRGVIRISPTDVYGNFEKDTVSRSVQKLINSFRSKVVASVTYKTRNQYRLYGDDGTGICMTLCQTEKGTHHAFTQFEYPVNVACTISGEDANGKDVVFFGSDEGMVYQADKGSSFDGEDIESYIVLPFNHSDSPSYLKDYRKAVIEMTAEGYTSLRIHPEFSYGDPSISTHLIQFATIQGVGGFWDVGLWESFYYDAAIVAMPELDITGCGTNMAIVVYSKSAIDLGHKLNGVLFIYTPRRIIR